MVSPLAWRASRAARAMSRRFLCRRNCRFRFLSSPLPLPPSVGMFASVGIRASRDGDGPPATAAPGRTPEERREARRPRCDGDGAGIVADANDDADANADAAADADGNAECRRDRGAAATPMAEALRLTLGAASADARRRRPPFFTDGRRRRSSLLVLFFTFTPSGHLSARKIVISRKNDRM